MSTSVAFKPIVTDSLVYILDAANKNSFISGNTTSYDLSGNNYNGSLIGGVLYDQNNAGSFKFDGVDEYISLGLTTPKLYPRTNSYTWCGWLKFSGASSNRQIWYGNSGGGSDGFSLILNQSGGINRIQVEVFGTTGGRQQKNIAVTNYLNTWNYWTIVLDVTTYTLKVYVNNILISNDVLSNWGDIRQEPSGGLNELYIGCYNGTLWFYNGYISNIMVYNKALSESEISQNYNALKYRFI